MPRFRRRAIDGPGARPYKPPPAQGAGRGPRRRCGAVTRYRRRSGREAHLSTVEVGPQAAAWVPRPYGDDSGPPGAGEPPRQGPQAPIGLNRGELAQARGPGARTPDASRGISARGSQGTEGADARLGAAGAAAG